MACLTWLAGARRGSPPIRAPPIVQSLHLLVPSSTNARPACWPRHQEPAPVAPSRPGTTTTCVSWPPTSRPRSRSRTSVPRSARRCSRRTVTRSGTATGRGCTTATWTASPCSSATSPWRSTSTCSPIEGGRRTRSCSASALGPPAGRRPTGRRVARAVGCVEETAQRHGVAFPVQMTVATTDGETVWAFRYSSEGRSRSLFHSTDISTLHHRIPTTPAARPLRRGPPRVSEPLGDLRGACARSSRRTRLHRARGTEELRPFAPACGASTGGAARGLR